MQQTILTVHENELVTDADLAGEQPLNDKQIEQLVLQRLNAIVERKNKEGFFLSFLASTDELQDTLTFICTSMGSPRLQRCMFIELFPNGGPNNFNRENRNMLATIRLKEKLAELNTAGLRVDS